MSTRNSFWLVLRKPWLLAAIVYAVYCLHFLRYEWYLINTDMVSYITIAEKYARFDLVNAINGHWSPLISWLMVPFMWMGLEAEFSFVLVLFMSGFVAFYFADRIASKLAVPLAMRFILSFGLVMLLANGAMNTQAPDLLNATLLLVYLDLMLGFGAMRQSSGRLLLIGCIAGVAYLAKHYTLVFFGLHFGLVALISVIKSVRSKQLRSQLISVAMVLVGFVMVTAGWSILLSFKYGQFTLSRAATYSQAMHHPALGAYPHLAFKLYPLPNATAVNAWEDPSDLHNASGWNPFGSAPDFNHLLTRLGDNIVSVHRQMMNYFNLYWLPLLLLPALTYVKPLRFRWNHELIVVFVAFLVFPVGYLFLHVRERFLLFMIVLMALLTMKLFSHFSRPDVHISARMIALMLAIAFIWQFSRHPFRETYYSNTFETKNHYLVAKRFGTETNLKGAAIVSNADFDLTYNVSYLAGLKFYGLVDLCDTAFALEEIREFKPDYYFEWQHLKRCDASEGFVPVEGIDFYNLKVYRMANRGGV